VGGAEGFLEYPILLQREKGDSAVIIAELAEKTDFVDIAVASGGLATDVTVAKERVERSREEARRKAEVDRARLEGARQRLVLGRRSLGPLLATQR
jgi:hypothetical protein